MELPNLISSEVHILSYCYLPVSMFLDINFGKFRLLVAGHREMRKGGTMSQYSCFTSPSKPSIDTIGNTHRFCETMSCVD